MSQYELITDLENIKEVIAVYEADEDGAISLISIDKHRMNHGWTDLFGVIDEPSEQIIKERCADHLAQARADEDEALKERELGL